MPPRLALVDCNNFYVSCERVFRPDLNGKPVAVLSNNDGCIVARSQEVKDLCIKMGVPLFKVMPLVKRHHIRLFSSNYALYADMSSRVMSILERFAPSIEIYSIDEAFLDLAGINDDPYAYGQAIRAAVLQFTGVPVCVGMGTTKTLAKLANYAAKKWPHTQGVLDLSDPKRLTKLMPLVPVNEVWGIGAQTAAKLNALGIMTVADLVRWPPNMLQNHFSVTLAHTIMELNGIPCLDLEVNAPDKQQIVCSRSFSHKVTAYSELAQALADYSQRVAEKLRHQHSTAGYISIFIRTGFFNNNEPQYQRSAGQKLGAPTQDSRMIAQTAHHLLKTIYMPNYAYQKCGVQLGEIVPDSQPMQLSLFDNACQAKPRQLTQTLDQINRRYPKSMGLASAGFDKKWNPKTERISKHYTTNWAEIMVIK